MPRIMLQAKSVDFQNPHTVVCFHDREKLTIFCFLCVDFHTSNYYAHHFSMGYRAHANCASSKAKAHQSSPLRTATARAVSSAQRLPRTLLACRSRPLLGPRTPASPHCRLALRPSRQTSCRLRQSSAGRKTHYLWPETLRLPAAQLHRKTSRPPDTQQSNARNKQATGTDPQRGTSTVLRTHAQNSCVFSLQMPTNKILRRTRKVN